MPGTDWFKAPSRSLILNRGFRTECPAEERIALIDLVEGIARLAARAVSRFGAAEVLVSAPGPEPMLALTFDDGPDPETTPRLLTILAEHGARATFFVIGERAREYPDLLARIVAGGHELGNHLQRDQPSVRLSRPEFERQLADVHTLLQIHGPVRFFRPGSGWFSPRMLRSAARLRYRCALGSIGLVAARYPDPAALAARMAGRCRRGSIVVLHEGGPGRADVVEVTDRLLRLLSGSQHRVNGHDHDKGGLRSVTLSELVARHG